MELSKISDKTVSTVPEKKLVPESTARKKRKILTEEEYTEEMEKIITRDFFPDLPRLKAQNEYLDALEKGDMAKVQEIQMAYKPTLTIDSSRASSVGGIFSTPATFETPDVSQAGSPLKTSSNETEENETTSASVPNETEKLDELDKKKKKDKALDQFLSEATSEDNASFEVIMEKSAQEHQNKYPWLYKDEKLEENKLSNMLALTYDEKKAIDGEKKPELVMWSYKNKNALMYVPDGAELTAEEKLAYENRKVISHENTRFVSPPFDEQANKEAIAEAASLQAKMKEGKVGIDGKELIPGESPEVNGYGFVGSPSPRPGVTDTPIMTWGEIEGTPFRLDGSDTPLPQNPGGQQFKIPNLSAREKIALSLADKAAKKHRKQNIKTPTSIFSPRSKYGSPSPMTTLERLQSMSPAAQKLACAKLGIQRETDRALWVSYSPSPLHAQNRDRTPIAKSPAPSTPVQNKPTVITPSQTESMLSIPKRSRAKDFF